MDKNVVVQDKGNLWYGMMNHVHIKQFEYREKQNDGQGTGMKAGITWPNHQ